MNGRLDKVAMTNKLMQLKREIHYKCEIGEKNEGYFGPIMEKNGKLNRDEICHYCYPSDYAKSARQFCKLHHKVWRRR